MALLINVEIAYSIKFTLNSDGFESYRSGMPRNSNGALIAPDKLVTTKSKGNVSWVSFEDYSQAYQVIHSEKHPTLDLQILFLNRDVTYSLTNKSNIIEDTVPLDSKLFVWGRTKNQTTLVHDILQIDGLYSRHGILDAKNDSLYVQSSKLGQAERLFTNDGIASKFIVSEEDEGSPIAYEKQTSSYSTAAYLVGIYSTRAQIVNPKVAELAEKSGKPVAVFYDFNHPDIKNWMSSVLMKVVPKPKSVPNFNISNGESQHSSGRFNFRSPEMGEIPTAAKRSGTFIDPNVILTTKDSEFMAEFEKYKAVFIGLSLQMVDKAVPLSNDLKLLCLSKPVANIMPMKRFRGISDQVLLSASIGNSKFAGLEVAYHSAENNDVVKSRVGHAFNFPDKSSLKYQIGSGFLGHVGQTGEQHDDYQLMGVCVNENAHILLDTKLNQEIDKAILDWSLEDKNAKPLPSSSSSTSGTNVNSSSSAKTQNLNLKVDPRYADSLSLNYVQIDPNWIHSLTKNLSGVIVNGKTKRLEQQRSDLFLAKLKLPNDSESIQRVNLASSKSLYGMPLYVLAQNQAGSSELRQFSLTDADATIATLSQLIIKNTLPILKDLNPFNYVFTINEDRELQFAAVLEIKQNQASLFPFTKIANNKMNKAILADSLKVDDASQQTSSQSNVIPEFQDAQFGAVKSTYINELEDTVSGNMEMFVPIDPNHIIIRKSQTDYKKVFFDKEENNCIGQHDFADFKLLRLQSPVENTQTYPRRYFKDPTELNGMELYLTYVSTRTGNWGRISLSDVKLNSGSHMDFAIALPGSTNLVFRPEVYVRSESDEDILVGIVESTQLSKKNLLPNKTENVAQIRVAWLTSDINDRLDHLMLSNALEGPKLELSFDSPIKLDFQPYAQGLPAPMWPGAVYLTADKVMANSIMESINMGSNTANQFELGSAGVLVPNTDHNFYVRQIQPNKQTGLLPVTPPTALGGYHNCLDYVNFGVELFFFAQKQNSVDTYIAKLMLPASTKCINNSFVLKIEEAMNNRIDLLRDVVYSGIFMNNGSKFFLVGIWYRQGDYVRIVPIDGAMWKFFGSQGL